MKVLWKVIAGIGIALVCMGVAGLDSPSMLFPVAMITSGAAMAGASAIREGKWTEE